MLGKFYITGSEKHPYPYQLGQTPEEEAKTLQAGLNKTIMLSLAIGLGAWYFFFRK